MDAGADVAWPERFNHDEVSAIQHAMNLKLQDEAAFFAEYQNEPIVETEGEEMLTAEEIATKLNGYDRGAVPLGAAHLTMFIDVQQKTLFWLIAAFMFLRRRFSTAFHKLAPRRKSQVKRLNSQMRRLYC